MEIKYNYKNLEHLKDFFYENQNLFEKHRNGNRITNKHADNIKKLKEIHEIKFPYGYCFSISQFIFYYLGHYKSKYNLMCIKKLPLEINGLKFTTSHWFVKKNEDNFIIDYSKEQFEKIINIEDFYDKGIKSCIGFKWFFKNGNRYEYIVPSRQVLKLYEEYRKIEINENLEFFYQKYIQEKNNKSQ